MVEVGTGLIIQVMIESCRGTQMRDLDFTCEFYAHSNRKVSIPKNKMIRIASEGGDAYYALVDTACIGAGELKTRVLIKDQEPKWTGGARPVIIRKTTGEYIGVDANPYRNTYVRNSLMCEHDYESGYHVEYNFVCGIPKAEVAYIFYGKLVDQINSFDEITAEMLVSPDNNIVSVSAEKMGKTVIAGLQPGNKVAVLVPEDSDFIATKDNGIGGKVAFDETVMGANGNKVVSIDGENYRVYGEFMTVSGELFIYVD